jgi:uncharacterized membrane protein
MIGIILTAIVLALIGAAGVFAGRHRFAARLRKELPHWLEQGWITEAGAAQILQEQSGRSRHSVSTAFAMLGVLLFGSGVITFFAANWDEISKITKLILLFGAMWGALAAAAWCRSHAMRLWLSEAVVLLAVIMFGANIMLIAQIYHIDAHYPDGVLTWALGALLTAWLLRSRTAFLAAIVLATLWSGMEAIGFHRFHWPFLLVFAALVWLMYSNRWRYMLHPLMLAFLLWSLFCTASFTWWDRHLHLVYLTQSYFLFYLTLFLGGMHLALTKRTAVYAEVVQKYAAFAAIAAFFVLTFPRFLEARYWGVAGIEYRGQAQDLWLWVTVALLAALAGLALWHRKRAMALQRHGSHYYWGLGLLAVILAIMVANLFVFGESGGAVAVVFNLLFFAALVWLIYFGMQEGDRHLVNMAFAFFAAALLARYFDTFWELLDRSLFFMAGGALLVGLGIFFERQRRRMLAALAGQEGGSHE